ncbi:hypothetical protein [Pseudooceanicola nanhaiensis]|uniref:hypothetical protein n=1 Tax=Pseudooceanicola nanhaiensis TaxID=375761 RepID=UPI001CD769E4|nr:hypothetical protein [Pseudooceanicola nanhaiensis]MCA0922310.1 hypothetical protein [Pseudooceanicola nanhaiensis]
MTLRSPSDRSSGGPAPRGGAAVGQLTDLDAVAAGAVLCLRGWCHSPESRAQTLRDFIDTLGPDLGGEAAAALDEICALCHSHGRRPLMRHHLSCTCLGGDEACFGHFIAAAAEGAREDAMMFATLIARPDMAPCLLGLAEGLGLALTRMTRHPRRPADARLH